MKTIMLVRSIFFAIVSLSQVYNQAIPTVSPINGACDVRSFLCDSTLVLGSDFEDGNIKCHVEKMVYQEGTGDFVETGEIYMMGIQAYLDGTAVICEIPLDLTFVDGSPSMETGRPVSAAKVRISNDGGLTLSTGHHVVLIFDSKCVECNEAVLQCNYKSDACLINGFCFVNNEDNPEDTNERCDVSRCPTKFVKKEGASISTGTCDSNFCADKQNGDYEIQCSDSDFITCSNKITYCQKCAAENSLVFNQVCDQCLYGYYDPCYTTPIPVTAPFVTPIPNCPDICGNTNGTLVDPTNANRFIVCQPGFPRVCMNCPATLIFDEIKELCDWP